MKPRLLFTLFLLSLLAAACSTGHRAPVTDTAGGPISLYDGRTHRVNDGETLYAIAWMYDLDYNALARANNIAPPYIIHRDQLLRVDIRSTAAVSSRTAAANAAGAPQAVVVSPVTITRRSETVSPAAVPANPPASTAARPAGSPASVSASVRPRPPVPVPEAPSNGPLQWTWPAAGPIVGRFSASGTENKGIDIGGSRGQDVVAAAAGEVVFAGSGLLRYGEMIILKHNEEYLSAYAHNSRLLVREGERVRRGQKIAELGSTGINREMLHFEIRQEGKPVDPLRHLPSR